MHVDGNAAPVVFDRDAIVAQNRDIDFGAKSGQRLVDRVVDDLGDKMMQPALRSVADVHTGTLADRFETFENLDGLRAVAVIRWFVCHRKRRVPPSSLNIEKGPTYCMFDRP